MALSTCASTHGTLSERPGPNFLRANGSLLLQRIYRGCDGRDSGRHGHEEELALVGSGGGTRRTLPAFCGVSCTQKSNQLSSIFASIN